MEDLDHSMDQMESDSYILNIDSSERDRVAYPHPSEYTINFSEPFRLVHGLEILDASIPNTMYTIDVHNRTLALINVHANIWRPVDYYGILHELQSAPDFRRLMDETRVPAGGERVPDSGERVPAGGERVLVVQDEVGYEVPPAQGGDEGVYLAKRRVARDVWLELWPLAEAGTAYDGVTLVSHEGSWYRVVTLPSSGTGGMAAADLLGALLAGDAFLRPQSPGLFEVVYYTLYPTTSAFVASLVAGSEFECRFDFVSLAMPVGNYDVLSFQNTLLDTFRTAGLIIDIQAVSTNDVRQRNQFHYVASLDAPFVFNMKASSMRTVMGFDEHARAADAGDSYIPVPFQGNHQLFGSMYDARMGRQRITCPGLMDFSGIRFITLHCPELESHMYSSLAYGSTSTGIGVFKMGSSGGNDITFLRFDFAKFHKKSFHPIGRLPRLSFRFQLPNGNLYDFKGINHNIMMVIKYYVPRVVKRVFPSTLNPNYTPDALRELLVQRGRDDDEDDIRDLTDQELALVRERERMYDDYLLPESSSSHVETTSSDEEEDCYA